MHKRRLAAMAALFVSSASLTTVTASAAHATSATTLYVSGGSSTCTDQGSGTAAAPFCTIQAAANVVAPGQTVLIADHLQSYDEQVTVSTSGTSAAPITFKAADTYFEDDGAQHAFVLSGVSNVVIDGLYATTSGDSVQISNSSDVTVENSTLRQTSMAASAITGVHITGSQAITVQRDRFTNASFTGGPQDSVYGDGILVDGGSTGTILATNYLDDAGTTGISVTGSSGTEITGNTVVGEFYLSCDAMVSVTSGSTDTTIENNVVDHGQIDYGGTGCSADSAPDLLVSADSAPTTSEKYNDLVADQNYGMLPYDWAGTRYGTVEAFQTATGQGQQDANPSDYTNGWTSIPSGAPRIDSADAAAPGETATDIYGNPRVDDPQTANTGSGAGYYDRGAIEYQEYTSASLSAYEWRPQEVSAVMSLRGIPWGSSLTLAVNWGDGKTDTESIGQGYETTDYTTAVGAGHLYASRGTHTITLTLTDAAGSKSVTGTVTTTGSTYAPVTPTRVLDTRKGIGTGGSMNPVAAGASLAFDVTDGVAGAPASGTITAVVLNITVTQPQTGGYITAYPDGTARPTSSNLDFPAGVTVPNLVTVKVGADCKVDLYNGSGGTAHLIADVAGYYVDAAGSGYNPIAPTRLLDTRKGIGTGGKTAPIAANGTLKLKIAGNGPVPATGVKAVAVNLTVTAPTGGGYLTAYPGGTRPTVSNLDFSAGQTVPNLAVVPVAADGTISLTNTSGGTTHLIADVAGYYTATAGHAFVPVDPVRVFDSRLGWGEDTGAHPIPAGASQFMDIEQNLPDNASALVLNVTVTRPQTGGYLTVYPHNTTRPTASNIDFNPGQTVPNLVMVTTGGPEWPLLYNGSAGNIDAIADVFGYFS